MVLLKIVMQIDYVIRNSVCSANPNVTIHVSVKKKIMLKDYTYIL